jgi:hypothetical protein
MIKALLRKVLVPVTVCWFIAVIVYGFLAYSVVSGGLNPTDGLGRSLEEAPWFMRMFFGQDKMWAGWKWFGIEMAVFWGGIGLYGGLAKWLDEDKLDQKG